MTEQDQQAYSQLNDVYKRQKAEFNEWKTANSRQSGTQEYLDYCNRFKLWEKDVKKQMAEYEAKLGRPTAGPVGPETILNDLLRKVDEMQFLMSIIQMSSQDKTFLPALLDANKKLQAQQPSFSGAPVAYTPTPIHVPSAPYAAMMPFASVPAAFGSPQIMPISVAPSPMPYAFASPVIPGVGNAPITVVTASTIPPYSAPWRFGRCGTPLKIIIFWLFLLGYTGVIDEFLGSVSFHIYCLSSPIARS